MRPDASQRFRRENLAPHGEARILRRERSSRGKPVEGRERLDVPLELGLAESLFLLSLQGSNGRWTPPRDARFHATLRTALLADAAVKDRQAPTLNQVRGEDVEALVAGRLKDRTILDLTLEPVLPFILRREYVLLEPRARREVVWSLRDAVIQHVPMPDETSALALLVEDAMLWRRVVPFHELRQARARAAKLQATSRAAAGPLTRRVLAHQEAEVALN